MSLPYFYITRQRVHTREVATGKSLTPIDVYVRYSRCAPRRIPAPIKWWKLPPRRVGRVSPPGDYAGTGRSRHRLIEVSCHSKVTRPPPWGLGNRNRRGAAVPATVKLDLFGTSGVGLTRPGTSAGTHRSSFRAVNGGPHGWSATGRTVDPQGLRSCGDYQVRIGPTSMWTKSLWG
jgi:hypothetical protein